MTTLYHTQSKTDTEPKRTSAQRGASPRVGFTTEYNKEKRWNNMSVQELFRILPDYEKVLFNTKHVTGVWYGLVKDIPSNYFDYIIDTIYSMSDDCGSYIVINFS